MGILAKLFGTKNDRELKALAPRVAAIKALEPTISGLTDAELAQRITEHRSKIEETITQAEKQKETLVRADYVRILDPYLNEVFAIVREAGKRVLNMRHFDVQILGGMVLHSGKIAEMKTGEGKTLVATLPAVLNALTGKGVHVVTVNDYLASRDAEWMGRIYRFLGLKVGVVLPHTSDREKKVAYSADITYGQNNEFGFDYLRDNMKFSLNDYVQRGHHFAIVDEVDSILIDEARTPLIISGPAEESTDKYKLLNQIIPQLRKDTDYTIDEKSRVVLPTESGISRCEKLLGIENLYDPINIELLHHLGQALRAHSLFKRDVDYVIEKGEVVIVDEHTGRLMKGRRWSDGLHQAIEAKENVKVQAENHTLATITFQNLFRMYKKLSGMTGTADTEAEEFAKIYDLDVMVIPTNRPMVRLDQQDLVFKSEHGKLMAIVNDIEQCHKKGQPILVGTVSVEKSEVLARELKKLGIAHNVLNAKKHRDEAGIVAQAGRIGAMTIATNMAGRGTDIILGGDPEFMVRSEVAMEMHQSNEQVAEFAFLTGRPDLINSQKLAERDKEDIKYLEELEASLSEAGDEQKPKSLADAQAAIYERRKDFYDRGISLYSEKIKSCEEQCKKEKEQVLAAGGLRIIGTERHESRRIDNQLRGRSGRQGDPGSSCFYLSLEDDLMRIFGSDRMISVMNRLGMEDDVPIEHPWVSKSIANAQKRVEGHNFDSRKQLIEYDDVMNQQRNSIYSLRRKVLGGENIRNLIFDLVEQAVINVVSVTAPEKTAANEWKLDNLKDDIFNLLGVRVDLSSFNGDRNDLLDTTYSEIVRFYDAKEKALGSEVIRQLERFIYLQTIDRRWKDHLQAMDHLREGIHFRGYAQKDPKQEYKKEGFLLFRSMMANIRDEALERVFKAEITQESSELATNNLFALRDKQEQEAQRLRQHQKLVHGSVPQQKAAPVEDDAESGLNRRQRRLMKSMDRKEKKKPHDAIHSK